MNKCPSCRNELVQPFVCTTCGAEKLYDETTRSQAAQIERLRAKLQRINAINDSPANFNREIDKLTSCGNFIAPDEYCEKVIGHAGACGVAAQQHDPEYQRVWTGPGHLERTGYIDPAPQPIDAEGQEKRP